MDERVQNKLGSSPYLKDNELSISKLATYFGKEPVKRTLPNGKEVEQIVWEPKDMVMINQELHNNKEVTHAGTINIDGAAPAWLVAGIAHECHPASCTASTPQGKIPIGCKPPDGKGEAENISFLVAEENGWKTIHAEQKDPSVPLSLQDIGNWTPPEIEMGSQVILSGRMPNVAMASLAQAYQHKAKAVGFLQPGVGSTVSITHSPEIALGTVIPESNISNKKEKLIELSQQVKPSNLSV